MRSNVKPTWTIRNLPEVLRCHFKLGSERRRRLYEHFRGLFNHRAIAGRRAIARELDAEAKFTVPHQSGFIGFPPGKFAEAPLIVEQARQRVARMDPRATKQPDVATQGLFGHLLNPDELTLASPFLRFILRPDIIAAISNYFGMVPVLSQIDLWYSCHYPELNGSQLYHCDWSSTTHIKVFVHCSNVGVENGPVTLIDADTSQAIRRQLKYTYDRNGRYWVSDQEIEALGGMSAQHVLSGPAGSVFFADTSRCFHYGSRIAEGAAPRLMVMFKLLIPSAFQFPLRFSRGAALRKLAHNDMPPYQRLVLGGD